MEGRAGCGTGRATTPRCGDPRGTTDGRVGGVVVVVVGPPSAVASQGLDDVPVTGPLDGLYPILCSL